MVLVTLTSTGVVKRAEVDSNDPYYKGFFDSILEATGELPTTIPVPDYVLDQFPAWLRLQEWMDIGPRVFYPNTFWFEATPIVKYTESEEDQQLLAEAIAAHPELQPYEVLLRGIRTEGPMASTPEAIRRAAPPLVFLADVRIIMGFMIEAPLEWVRYAAVDERSPPTERRDHYRAVGRLIRSGRKQELHNTTGVWPERLYGDFNMEYDPIYLVAADTSPNMIEEILGIEWLNITAGIRHNALLQMIVRGDAESITSLIGNTDRRGDPDWTLINWNDVCDFVNFNWFLLNTNNPQEGLNIVKGKSRVHNIAYALAGRRLKNPPKQPAVFAPLFVNHTSSARATYTLKTFKQKTAPIVVHISHLSLLYDRTLKSLIGEDGDSMYNPIQLGLSPILTGGMYRDINKYYTPNVKVIPASRGPHEVYEASLSSLCFQSSILLSC